MLQSLIIPGRHFGKLLQQRLHLLTRWHLNANSLVAFVRYRNEGHLFSRMHHLIEPLDLDGILAMRAGPRVDNIVLDILGVKAQVKDVVAVVVCFDTFAARRD